MPRNTDEEPRRTPETNRETGIAGNPTTPTENSQHHQAEPTAEQREPQQEGGGTTAAANAGGGDGGGGAANSTPSNQNDTGQPNDLPPENTNATAASSTEGNIATPGPVCTQQHVLIFYLSWGHKAKGISFESS